MRYFVHAEDGNRYGPAEVGMLNKWIEEGRLLPAMMLEEEGSRHAVTAASVGGLEFYEKESDPAAPAVGGGAVAIAFEQPVESVKGDMMVSWLMVLATLGFSVLRNAGGFIALFTTLLGIIAAIKAKERGESTAGAAIVVNLLAFVVWLAVRMIMAMT